MMLLVCIGVVLGVALAFRWLDWYIHEPPRIERDWEYLGGFLIRRKR